LPGQIYYAFQTRIFWGSILGMQITKFSDLALRTLIQLAVSPERRYSAREIADLHGVSFNHVAKVTQWLTSEGHIRAQRGRNGGISLALPADGIKVGSVLRRSEAGSALVECMRDDGGHCCLSPACGLAPYLNEAQEAFFTTLDNVSVQDVVSRNVGMARLVRSLDLAANG
jgi:Rrf2 family nitric oxide-sensitive transcriptional repressor